jgi:hypothetical protein
LKIPGGVKSHGDTFLKGTAPKTNPKIQTQEEQNPKLSTKRQ